MNNIEGKNQQTKGFSSGKGVKKNDFFADVYLGKEII